MQLDLFHCTEEREGLQKRLIFYDLSYSFLSALQEYRPFVSLMMILDYSHPILAVSTVVVEEEIRLFLLPQIGLVQLKVAMENNDN